MMARILRIELRRGPALVIALLSLALGTALLLSFREGFAGRWLQLAANSRGLLTVLWPLALAGGAWLGRREPSSGVTELLASTVRPRWQRILPTAGALAGAVVAAYLLMFLIGAAWVAPTAGYFPVATLPIVAVGALSLVAAAWLGMAAGRAVPRVVTAPVLAVVGVAVVGFLPDWVLSSASGADRTIPGALLLSPVLAGGLDDFQTLRPWVHVLQTLWLAALAATGLGLLGAVRRRGIALAVLPVALGAAVAVPALPADGYPAAVRVDPDAVALVCDNDGAPVCVTRVHAGLLPDLVGPAREALNQMAKKLPNAPVRAVENQQSSFWWLTTSVVEQPSHPADTLVFHTPAIGPTGRAKLADSSFVPDLFEAAWWQECPESFASTDGVFLAQSVAAAWLADRPLAERSWWSSAEREQAQRAYRTLTALPEAEQRRRMAAARDAAMDCRADPLLAILRGEAP